MPTKSLAAKLAEVSASIGRVPKNGYNNFHKYSYVLEADLVDHIRPLLSERNIFIIPRVGMNGRGENYNEYAHENDGEGLTMIVYEYDIIDGDTGEVRVTSAVGYGSDKGDKGAYKASTGAYKYMLMRLFQVATGDDPEGDERTDQRASGGTGPSVTVNTTSARPVGRGGKSEGATAVQINQIKRSSKELGLGIEGMKLLIDRVLGDSLVLPEEESLAAQQISDYLDAASSEDLGKLIQAMVAAAAPVLTTDEALDLKVGERMEPDGE